MIEYEDPSTRSSWLSVRCLPSRRRAQERKNIHVAHSQPWPGCKKTHLIAGVAHGANPARPLRPSRHLSPPHTLRAYNFPSVPSPPTGRALKSLALAEPAPTHAFQFSVFVVVIVSIAHSASTSASYHTARPRTHATYRHGVGFLPGAGGAEAQDLLLDLPATAGPESVRRCPLPSLRL
jgi:hypothetical protein